MKILLNLKDKFVNNVKNINMTDIVIFFIPIIIWSFVLYIYYPGFMSYDSFTQWKQIISVEFNNLNPFMHTFIEYLLTRIWHSPAVIAIFQIITFSTIWTSICKYNRKNPNVINSIMQIIVTLAIALVPLNAIHSITLWKDILYSYVILLMILLIQIGIDKKFKYTIYDYIMNGLNITLIMSLRHNGKLVGASILIILTVLIFLNNKKDNKKITNMKNYYLIMIFMCCFLLTKVPTLFYSVENKTLTIDSKLLHIIGEFNYTDTISVEDKTRISQYVNLEKLKEVYNPYFLDPVLESLKTNNLSANRSEMIAIILKSSFKHPKVLLSYLKDSTSIMWSVTKPVKAVGKVYGTVINFEDYSNATFNVYDIKMKNVGSELYNLYNKIIIETTLKNQFFYVIMHSPALYFYGTVVMIVILVYYTKNKYYFLLILPNGLNLLSLVVSIPLQDVRYVYTNFLTFYIVFIILISNLINDKFKLLDRKSNIKNI